MSRSFAQGMHAVRQGVSASLFTPLFLILTLIAVVHALQMYAVPAATGTFVTILLSKLVYYWYFIALAFVIERLSRRLVMTRRTAVQWSAVHLCAFASSFLVHEAVSTIIDSLLVGDRHPEPLLALLFNNPAVWIEAFAYGSILLGFSLLEYQRINRENELTCLLLEARLTKTTLQELRNNIQPAFLIGTLHSILALVREHRNRDANSVLSLLSDFLRTTVYDNDREEIPLEEELRFLSQFIEIEQVLSLRRFTARQEIARDVYGAVVPNFIFQPIVEALVLRMPAEDRMPCELVIRARKGGRMLEVEIEKCSSGGHAREWTAATDDRVLEVSRLRLLQLYGGDHAMSIFRSDAGVRVLISIPYREAITATEGIFIGEPAS